MNNFALPLVQFRRTIILNGLILIASFVFLPLPQSANGAIVVTAVESGSDVVFTASGSINTGSGDFFAGLADQFGTIQPDGFVLLGPQVAANIDFYEVANLSGPSNFGPGTVDFDADSGSGDLFGMNFSFQPGFALPENYVSGSTLSGSSAYAGQSFATLGMTPGDYAWSWSNGGNSDSLTLHVVPEPGSILVFSLAAVAIACRRRTNLL